MADNNTSNHHKSLEFNLGMLRYADAKAAALATFVIWLSNLLLDKMLLVSKELKSPELKCVFYSIVFVGGVCSVLAIYNLITALFPKTKSPLETTNLFAIHIANQDYEKFKTTVLDDQYTYELDVVNQIYVNASICSVKFKKLQNAIPSTVILLGLTFLLKILF